MEVNQSDSLSVFGIVIPSSKVESLCEDSGCKDKGSEEYQILSWNALATVIDDLVRDVNPENMKQTVAHLFAENIIRGKALFSTSCIKYQAAFPEKSFLYGALTAAVNSRFPAVGSLVMRRLFGRFMLSIQKNDCQAMPVPLKFLAHLINHKVLSPTKAHLFIGWCLNKKNPDYVKVSVEFFKELSLPAHSFGYMHDQLKSLRKHFVRCMRKYEIDLNVVNSVKELLAVWDSIFDGCSSVCPELEWTHRETIHCHDLNENDKVDMIIFQDDFKYDPIFLERETAFESFKRFVLLEGYWIPRVERVTREEWRRPMMKYFWPVEYPEICKELVQDLQPGSDVTKVLMDLCLFLLHECIVMSDIARCTDVLKRLCGANHIFKGTLCKCFFLVWLMLPGWNSDDMVSNAASLFASLLVQGTIPPDVLAYLQLMPQDRTMSQREFATELFRSIGRNLTFPLKTESVIFQMFLERDAVRRSLFPVGDTDLSLSAAKFFYDIELMGIAREIRKQSLSCSWPSTCKKRKTIEDLQVELGFIE